ncbi:MAG: hypothetical protein AAGU04_08125 [Anaerolineaceae bacterium]
MHDGQGLYSPRQRLYQGWQVVENICAPAAAHALRPASAGIQYLPV